MLTRFNAPARSTPTSLSGSMATSIRPPPRSVKSGPAQLSDLGGKGGAARSREREPLPREGVVVDVRRRDPDERHEDRVYKAGDHVDERERGARREQEEPTEDRPGRKDERRRADHEGQDLPPLMADEQAAAPQGAQPLQLL